MKEGISIGELSRFCDIPKQTLRYFEEKGLIHSQRSVNNGYRYYRYEDINQISDLITLRKMGMSISQMEELLNEADEQNYRDALRMVNEQLNNRLREIHHEQALIAKMQDNIKLINAELDSFKMSSLPSFHYVPLEHYDIAMKSLPTTQEMAKLGDYGPGGLISTADGIRIEWVMMRAKPIIGSEQITKTRAIETVIDLGAEGEGEARIQQMLTKANAKFPNLRFKEQLISRFLLRCHKNGRRVRYIQIWLPLKP